MKKIFYKQHHENTCGVNAIRTVFYNKFGIKISENDFIEKAQKILKDKRDGKPLQWNYEILRYGTDIYHFRNMAEHFGLKTFSSSKGKIDDLEYLINRGNWPIIHRKFEGENETHYLVVHNYDGRNIHLFDPVGENGGLKKEDYDLFYEKWLFENERWFILFYRKGQLMIPFKGKYL